MKKIYILLTLLVLFIPSLVFAHNVPTDIDTTKKIYDYANLFTDEEEIQMYTKITSFIEKNEMDVVIVTIDKNPYGVSDYYSQTYAQDFFDYNNFGFTSKKTGILFLIDMDNRYLWLDTSGDAILYFDDSRIDYILDEGYFELKNGEYATSIIKMIDKAESYKANGIPESNKNCRIDSDGEYYCEVVKPPKKVNWIVSIIIGAAVSTIALLVHLHKYKGIRLAINAQDYINKGYIVSGASVDQFISTHTSKTYCGSSNSSSGGGRSGGSSVSHGSSGHSHGGGGRHF